MEGFDRAIVKRLSDYDTLLKGLSSGMDPGALWLGFLATGRVRVGASSADMKVPFAWGTDLQRAAHDAVAWLLEALASRNKDEMEVGGLKLPPRAWGLRRLPDDSVRRQVGISALSTDTLLDGGLLSVWLEGPGGALFEKMQQVVRKGVDEQKTHRQAEPTGYLAGLACLSLVRAQKARVKTAKIRGVQYEALDRGIGLVLSELVAYAFRESFGVFDEGPILRLVANPMTMVAIRKSLLAAPVNAYGLQVDLLNPVLEATQGEDPARPLDEQTTEVARAVAATPELDRLAAELFVTDRFRAAVIRYLARYDLVPEASRTRLAELTTAHASLPRALASEPALAEELQDCVERLSAATSTEPEALQAVKEAATTLLPRKGLLKRKSSAPRPDDESRRWAAGRALLWRLDTWAAYYVDRALERLDDKAAEHDTRALKELYEAGRLYRFAPDPAPTLKEELPPEPQAHLFADIKGFTRRTSVAKAISTADFLKTEFYQPVLAAAGQIRHSGGLELNNMLGDAVSFSGRITAIVELGDAITQVQKRYRAHLAERDLAITTQQVVEQVRARRDAQIAGLDQEVQTLRRNLDQLAFDAAGGAGVGDEVDKLQKRLRELEQTREQTQKLAEREINALTHVGGLEAGLFIAFGAPVAPIEIDDAEFGDVRVAIAEGINESARGTARSPFVRRVLDAAVQAAIGEGRAEARLPFDVYVLRSEQHEVTDVYNLGQAMSREALGALIAEDGDRTYYERSVSRLELPESLRQQFVFLEHETLLRFVVGVPVHETATLRLFRHCGTVTFKGFERARPTEVYERIDLEGAFATALAPVVSVWVSELRAQPGEALSGPPEPVL